MSIEETLFHLRYNPILQIPGIRERFCDMIVTDAIIDNNDRNNGNWGILTVKGKNTLAPVFDNGNAFASKVDDEHLDTSPEVIVGKWAGGRSIYERGGHQLSNKNLFAAPIPGLDAAAQRVVSAYHAARTAIENLLMSLPDNHKGIPVCSQLRKEAYLAGMDARTRWLAEDFEL